MITAKQNQKFPFHFLSAPPTPPAEEKKKGKENFWFLLPRPQGADEARRLVLARIVLEKSSDFVQETQLWSEKEIWLLMMIGEVLGNLVPLLWDAGPLSFSSIIFTGLGGLLGIWIGFKLNNQKYNLA